MTSHFNQSTSQHLHLHLHLFFIRSFSPRQFSGPIPAQNSLFENILNKLVDLEKFKKLREELSKEWVFIEEVCQSQQSHAENHLEYWYAQPFQMFESYSFAEFTFSNGKLSSINIVIQPFRDLFADDSKKIKDTERFIQSITSALNAKYAFIRKMPSGDIPNAYILQFKRNASNVDFWVNLAVINNPALSLRIYNDTVPEIKHSTEITKREKTAF